MQYIKAKFIGTTSNGYVSGKTYELRIKSVESMSIERTSGLGYTTYESLSAFLRNWDNIIHITG